MRVLKFLGWSALVLPVVGVALVVSLNGCYQSRLSGAIATYQGRGEPVEPKDFPAPTAEGQANAEALLEAARPSASRTLQESDLADLLTDGYAVTPAQRQAIREMNDQYLPDEAELEAALQAGTVHWVNPPVQPVTTLMLPHLNPLRALANTLATDARLALLEGDLQRALARVRQVMRLAEFAGQDATLIGLLVSTGIDALACDLVYTGPTDLSREASQPLIAGLLNDGGRDERAKRGMWLERACLLETARSKVAASKFYARPTAGIVMFREMPALMEMSDLLSDAMREERADRRAALIARHGALSGGSTALFTRILGSSSQSAVVVARLRTERRIAAVLLALRAYRTEHDGRLPARLEELVPAYLPEIPLDPFDRTGGPLRYDPDRGVVYSAGTNETDDGGDTKEPKKLQTPNPWSAPDFGKRVTPPPPTTRPAEEEQAG